LEIESPSFSRTFKHGAAPIADTRNERRLSASAQKWLCSSLLLLRQRFALLPAIAYDNEIVANNRGFARRE
jgi:hypothetical protein